MNITKAIQFKLAIGLTLAAVTAKHGKLTQHDANKAIRRAVKELELPVSNQDIRLAVAIVYRKVEGE